MRNYWYDLANKVVEKEFLVYDRPDATSVFRDLPPKLSVMTWLEEDERWKEVGIVHSLRLMSKLGIEGVLKCPKRLHRSRHELSFNHRRREDRFRGIRDQYWVVLLD